MEKYFLNEELRVCFAIIEGEVCVASEVTS